MSEVPKTSDKTPRELARDEQEQRIVEHMARIEREQNTAERRWPKVELSLEDRRILRKFLFGLKLACTVEIWIHLRKLIETNEGRELAGDELESRFRISRTSLERGANEGRLSLETLLLLVTDLNVSFDTIGLPHRHDRILGGYREAIAMLQQQHGVAENVTMKQISLSELLGANAVVSVLARDEWIQLANNRDSPSSVVGSSAKLV
ncbi:MAG: hypothetical protein IH899_18470 [Planctomycetes bacterium]|nr:hypothetical protein [Planctomycetota bacterium]